MRTEPLVSVVVPLYNAEAYIKTTLESVKNQTFNNIELIVVDNASTDNSLQIVKDICDSIPNSMIIECNQNSGGPAKPRNLGIEASSGEYIALLDSDDVWLDNKLELQIARMEDAKLNFTCTSPSLIDENGKPIKRLRDYKIFSKNRCYGLRSLLFRNTITTSSVVVKSQFLSKHRFNEMKNMVTVEDYLLWLTLLNRDDCCFEHLFEKLVEYRVVGQSLGNKDGSTLFAAKSLLASSSFIVDNKKIKLLPIIILTHLARLILLYLTRRS